MNPMCHPRLLVILSSVVSSLAIGCAGSAMTAGNSPTDAAVSPDGPHADVHSLDDAHGKADAPPQQQDAQPGDSGWADSDAHDSCGAPPNCDAPLPDLGQPREWRHKVSKVTAKLGDPRHRGRDLFLKEGQPAWVLGKFAYGTVDKDIKDENIDVYLLRDCGTIWEKVGTFRTTGDGDHPTVHGVEDTGGRIYVDLQQQGVAPLGVGMHRVLMVVAGDLSYANQYIDVLPDDAKVVVTDIDGTLTSSEYAAVTDVVGLPPAEAHPGAAAVMNAFATRGYHLFYLTARPEWMMHYTRSWLPDKGFPQGIVHTTLSGYGAVGGAAADYKKKELAWLKQTVGVIPSYAFGNKDSDVQAYSESLVPPGGCYYYQLDGDLNGGHRLDSYTDLVSFAQSVPLACP